MSRFRFAGILIILSLLAGLPAQADTADMEAEARDGILNFSTPDGQYRWWLDARIYLDGAFFIEDKNSLGDGFQLRRGRFAWKSILGGDWYAEIDVDLAEEHVEFKDAYISWLGMDNRQIRIGNFREPYGLEENTTSRYLMFMERSQGTDAFVPGRRMGLEYSQWRDTWRIAAGVFGPDIEDFETKNDDQTFNFTGRGTLAPHLFGGRIHVGASHSLRSTYLDRGDVEFKSRNEYHVNDYKFLRTEVKDVDSYTMTGAEFAFVRDRLTLQAEHSRVKLDRSEAELDPVAFSGYYAYLAWFLTPDTHPYNKNQAEFGRVLPSTSRGAWEVSARFSSTDMSDQECLGGESTSKTLGLTWYANSNIKFYLNYVMVDNDINANADGSVAGDDDFSVFQFRILAAF